MLFNMLFNMLHNTSYNMFKLYDICFVTRYKTCYKLTIDGLNGYSA
jgi:hypothetical protein